MKEYGKYKVKSFYAGVTGYVVYEYDKEVYCGYSVDEIIERFGFNPNEL